jgi:hypothetical protein
VTHFSLSRNFLPALNTSIRSLGHALVNERGFLVVKASFLSAVWLIVWLSRVDLERVKENNSSPFVDFVPGWWLQVDHPSCANYCTPDMPTP